MSGWSDEAVAGRPAVWGDALVNGSRRAALVACLVATAGIVLAAGPWPWRRTVAGEALAAAVVGCALVHLGDAPDRVSPAVGTEPIHWVPVALIPLAAVVALWPRRAVPPSGCTRCGYGLTGSVSGVCPGCGTRTTPVGNAGPIQVSHGITGRGGPA